MARTAQEVLEFDKLRELLRLRTTCAPGRRGVDALEPGTSRVTLESAFALIREAREWLRGGRELGFGALADPQGWLESMEGPGAVLEPGELLDAASLLETAGWLGQQFREEAAKFPLLAARAASTGDFRDVHAAIRRCLLPNGGISDDASTALKRIRASITETRESIQKTLQQILRARNGEPGEDYVTLRNERFVIFVRARFARDFDAHRPEFSEANELRLEAARHPVLEDKLKKENRAIVPMTLSLGGQERVLVISGPNTGGKTVALKTVGMAALAAQ